MGDRANVYLVDTDKAKHGMYLYSHYYGAEWVEQLRQALDFGRSRWGDPQYLARVLASRMFTDIADGTVGGGLSTRIGDNSYAITVVDLVNGTVGFTAEGEEGNRKAWRHVVPFADFVAQDVAKLPRHMDEN